MTLPDERFRAVRYARQFLYDLMDPKKTPGVPRIIREQARSVLRHYPDDYHMVVVSEASPQVFQQQMEPLTRMMAQWSQTQDQQPDRTIRLKKPPEDQ